MNKKKKNGFTLVELMAVVVILIIILLIAINKVKDAGQKTHMNAIKSSAIAFKNAVRDRLSSDLVEEGPLDSGIFTPADLENYGVKVSGKQPTGGYFIVSDYKIYSFCIEYEGAYHLIDNPKGISNVKDGKCDTSISYSNIYEFSYIGAPQTFTAPKDGIYLVELWGAQGGSALNAAGGKGAYTSGLIGLAEGEELFVYVGGVGKTSYNGLISGGWNGGGTSYGQNYGSRYWGSGGGATDIRISYGAWDDPESLASRVMVAAGGGGAFCESNSSSYPGGAGGALVGSNGSQWSGDNWCYGEGGTQLSGGRITTNCYRSSSYGNALTGSFGKGGDCPSNCTGGGGGYYGGSRSGHVASSGGGSSYISGYKGSIAIENESSLNPKCTQEEANEDMECSIHYSATTFGSAVMKAGNESMPSINGKAEMVGNTGNGYAKISLVSLSTDNTYAYGYTGKEEKFTAPKAGTYKIEAWGAQGGTASETYVGGYGAYATGTIELNKGDTIYINVGGKGADSLVNNQNNGGYNGGGNSYIVNTSCSSFCTPGGGATSVSLVRGLVKLTDTSKLLLVAGGGGGAETRWCSDSDKEYSSGGHGGGIEGVEPYNITNSWTVTMPQGGTQSAGGEGGTTNGESGAAAGTKGNGGQTTRTGGYTCSSGGGGGFYGGGNGMFIGGAGGSSYIGSSRLTDKEMYCYNCTEDDNENTKTTSTTCVNSSATSECAKKGNGSVRITKID